MRYIPLTEEDKAEILSATGLESVEKLFETIPVEVRQQTGLNLPPPMTEQTLMRHMKNLATQNRPASGTPSFLGAGAYDHFIPAAVDQLAGRSEFYTSYTPYQPEVSQGTLQAIYEFQSYVCALFGMDAANASMYDGASALAEAVLMACRISKKSEIAISSLVHPRWRQVVRSYTKNRGIKILEIEDHNAGTASIDTIADAVTENCAAYVVQSPNFFGNVEHLEEIRKLCADKKLLFIVGIAEPISLGLLKPPGDFGADIVVGEGQPLGLPLSYGGPYLGLFATRQKYLRQMPGRLCGKTKDSRGKDGFVLTLAAREQHIRRDKATSNICSNQQLCALTSSIFMTLLGKKGFCELARQNLYAARALKQKLQSTGKAKSVFDKSFFNEFVVELEEPAADVNRRLAKNKIIGGLALSRFYAGMENRMLLTATEKTTQAGIDKLLENL
ncbi:MAG: aminomethyl-transferring glycine dehydrogenase subunit GcvPA [Nitrospinota bacterium]